jgi:tryptophanyl-tRNA synthetase
MKRMVSGIKPTGELTLGNYLGAIKNFVSYQDDYELFLFVADLHALTTPQDKVVLRKRIRDVVTMYLACGLDPNKVTLFLQSEIAGHSQLGYLLESTSYMGELSRMTQYKDKMQKSNNESMHVSMFTYPVLMAADILLYDANYVPVGDDQKQHVELTRTLAERFNSRYGDFFVVPEPLIPETGARIMDLQEPTKKMSKSDASDKGYILLNDDLARIKNKIKSAVTDSIGVIQYDKKNQPGLANLLTILSSCTNTPIQQLVQTYQGATYAEFKEVVADAVVRVIEPIQQQYTNLVKSTVIDEVLDAGAARASDIAFKKVRKANQLVGVGRKR